MPLGRDEPERRLVAQPSTSHNIRLTPEVTTIPGWPDFLETDLRLAAIVRALSLVYHRRLAGLRVADLGRLEGGFALALARHGMNVVEVEARQANLDKARLLNEHFALPNLEFCRDDVTRFTRERHGPDVDRESQLWASYSNGRSFWLTKEALLRAILGCGFDLLWEQQDYSATDYRLHNVTYARGLFCAVTSGTL